MENQDNIKNIFQKAFQDFDAEPGEKVWKGIEKELHPGKRKRGIVFYWVAAASLLLLVLSVPVFRLIKNKTNEKTISQLSGVDEETGKSERSGDPAELRDGKTERQNNEETGKSERSGDPAELRDGKKKKRNNVIEGKQEEDKADLTPSDKETIRVPEQTIALIGAEKPVVLPEGKYEKIPGITPYLSIPLEEQKIRKGYDIQIENNLLPPEPLLASNKWTISAGMVSGPDYTTAGGEPRTYTIPNSGTTTLITSIDTTGYYANRTITWSQNTMQTDIGYIPVSTATIQYDTAWQTVPRVDTIRTPDKQITETPGDIKYGVPVMTGIELYYPVSNRLSVGSGLSWSMYTALQNFSYSDSSAKKVSSRLQYAGVPIHVIYYFIKTKKFTGYASAGAAMEWNISNKITTTSASAGSSQSTVSIQNNHPAGTQLYLTGGAGLEYFILKNLTLYLQPSVAVFTAKNKNPYHPSNNKKAVPAVQTGIRFCF